jgi:hypothetical protein
MVAKKPATNMRPRVATDIAGRLSPEAALSIWSFIGHPFRENMREYRNSKRFGSMDAFFCPITGKVK